MFPNGFRRIALAQGLLPADPARLCRETAAPAQSSWPPPRRLAADGEPEQAAPAGQTGPTPEPR